MSLGLQVDLTGLDRVIASIDAAPSAIERAAKRARTKATRFAAGRLATLLAADTDIPVRAIKVRTRSTNKVAWLGYNPIAAHYVGRMRQADDGASARDYWFPESFVATMPSGYQSIYHRAGKPRLPIVEDRVALPTAPTIAGQVANEVSGRLEELLKQELNYALKVEAG